MEPIGIKKAAFVGSYVPRRCGIATFTADLCRTIIQKYPDIKSFAVAVSDNVGNYPYPHEVRFEIDEKDLFSYRRAAEFINLNEVDSVCLQHEFGIFGGVSGNHILSLVGELKSPIVTTFHTVLKNPSNEQLHVMKKLDEVSSRLVVMTGIGKELLEDVYHVCPEKIDIIPHGIPDVPFIDPNFYKDLFGVEGKIVILTFGLLSPSKGIEHVLNALPSIVKEYPDTVYIVLGATHPKVFEKQGEAYRMGLEALAAKNGIKDKVIFHNQYVDSEQLKEFIGAADIYITPYIDEAQATSGTLSYSLGAGKAIISTPFRHARELLANDRGVLVPFNDPSAIASEVLNLLKDEAHRHLIRKNAYLSARDMVWEKVGSLYVQTFEKARISPRIVPVKRISEKGRPYRKFNLPHFRFDHLQTLTDSSGILQHAKYTVPDFAEGYCTDDNARALLLTVLLESLGIKKRELEYVCGRALGFLNYALDRGERRFRNFMSFGRDWIEGEGSHDSHGRAVWALGTCAGRTRNGNNEKLAAALLEIALSPVVEFSSPRAWAFSLVGIDEYLKRFEGDRMFIGVRAELTDKLMSVFLENSSKEWFWCEDVLSYSNAKLPQALIISGKALGRDDVLETGLKALRWLIDLQTTPEGFFRPIGCDGFYRRGYERANFDQQPIEAFATISACANAYRVSSESFWYEAANTAFEWFLGRNDLGVQVYDPETGGCRDGLSVDKVNQNEGAESTLAFLLSLTEMHLLEQS